MRHGGSQLRRKSRATRQVMGVPMHSTTTLQILSTRSLEVDNTDLLTDLIGDDRHNGGRNPDMLRPKTIPENL